MKMNEPMLEHLSEQLDRLRKELSELSKATTTLGLTGLSEKLCWAVQTVDYIKKMLKQK